MDLNNVTIIGRLTADAELKYISTGTALIKMSIATNKKTKKDDQWIDEVSFFDVTAWGKLAENLAQYLTKGKQIGVMGELHQSRWTNSDGAVRSKVEIITRSIQLLGGKKEDNAQTNNNAQSQNTAQTTNSNNEVMPPFDDGDIPF